MGKFLAILNGSADEESKVGLSEQQQTEFMSAWASWAQAHESALVDPGSPLYRKKLITTVGVEDFTDAKVAYAILAAESHDDAVRIFAGHPHLGLDPGNSIAVMECPEIPGG